MVFGQCRNCKGTGQEWMFFCGHDYDADGIEIPTGGPSCSPCQHCFGLGKVATDRPRFFRQLVAARVVASLTRRGESLFQVAARLREKYPIQGHAMPTIGMIKKCCDGSMSLSLAFPDGLIKRAARQVMRDEDANADVRPQV